MARTILVVEDSVTMQRVFELTLKGADYRLQLATTADEALAQAKQSPPDLILADLTLPGKSGFDLCAAVKGDPALARVPVYLLAGPSMPLDETRARGVRADGHFQKPFDTQAFLDRLGEAIGRASVTTAPMSSASPSGSAAAVAARRAAAPIIDAEELIIEIEAEPPSPTERAGPRSFPTSQHAVYQGARPASVGPSSGAGTAPYGGTRPGQSGQSPAAAAASSAAAAAAAAAAASASTRAPRPSGSIPSASPAPLRGGAPPVSAPGYPPQPTRQPAPSAPVRQSAVIGVGPQQSGAHSRPGAPPAGAPGASVTRTIVPGMPGPAVTPTGLRATGLGGQAAPRPGAGIAPMRPTLIPGGMPQPGGAPARPIPGTAPGAGGVPGTLPGAGAPHAQPAHPSAAGASARSVEQDAVMRMSRELIERIAWEVVPELAETIIKEELERLIAARGGQK